MLKRQCYRLLIETWDAINFIWICCQCYVCFLASWYLLVLIVTRPLNSLIGQCPFLLVRCKPLVGWLKLSIFPQNTLSKDILRAMKRPAKTLSEQVSVSMDRRARIEQWIESDWIRIRSDPKLLAGPGSGKIIPELHVTYATVLCTV
jgi:hypothetical protein